jgi:branched-chain amino acid transport system substrate-binding protein
MAASTFSATAQSAGSEPIKIGVILPLTGAGAGLGIPDRNGMQLAEKQINAAGGVNGRAIKLIIEDDTSNPDTALSKANGLIFGEKVVALLGPVMTANTVAIGGVSSPIKLPQIAFNGLGPAIERDRKCVFHVAPSQTENARAMLEYAKSIGVKNAAALFDSGYGTVVWNELSKYAESYGIKFVATEKMEIAATDATGQAAKIRAAQPDAVFVVGVTGVPVRAIRQLQMKQPIISAIGQATYEIVKSMGDAADNVVFPEFLVPEDPLPSQEAFVKMYKLEYGRLPKAIEAMGFDSVNIVAKAIAKVGPEAGNEAICNAIRGPYQGVMTNFDFGADDMTGIKVTGFIYSKLVNGQFNRLPFRVTQ